MPLRRRTWWPWAAGLGAVVLAAAAWLVPWRDWIAGQGVRSLERDVIVLAFEHPQGPSSLWEATRVALAVGLEQSCPARVMSDVQAGQLLAYMGRRSDEAVTTPVARELCQRAGAPAVVRAAVAALEQGFVVSLEAEACGSGNSIVRGQLFAASTSDLPRTAGRVAASVGQGLRGTLARATQGSRPLVLASTTSLAALRALSLGDAERERGHASEAVRLYERAVELDGQFATAYARLGSLQTIAATSIFPTSPTGRPASDDRRKADYLRRAFELRDRVSEPERFHIAALYYAWVARDVVKALELLQSWNQLYPGSAIPLFELARLRSAFLGNYEQAIGEGRQALQLSPGDVVTLIALCDASLGANRLDEARSVLEAASKSAPDLYGVHVWRYALAALAGDEHAVQGELRWASRDPAIAVEFARLEAQRAMAAGRTRDAARLWQTVRDWSAERGYQTSVAGAQANEALWRAWAGETEGVAEAARQAVAASDHPQVQMEGGVALALAGDLPGARGVVDRLRAAFPGENLLATRVFVPTVGAAIALSAGRPAEAVDRLRVAEPYELAKAYRLLPLALRCRANLAAGFPGEAVAACTKLVEHRAVHPTTLFYPLAHRDLAEAWRRLGDAGRADEAARRFRELWPR